MIKTSEILKKCNEWRKSSKTLVFTNGCFDLLHQGHLDLLNASSKFGDILLVGLNSDKSIKILKGFERPIESQNKRLKNLLKLNIVSDAFIFEDQTPIKLINLIKPDVIVKGGDYKPQDIVGAKEVEEWGGKVKIVNLTPGFSTTLSIKKNKREGLV